MKTLILSFLLIMSYSTFSQDEIRDWEKHQDSLRKEILDGKENQLLKESFLQEMYVRNVAAVANDSIEIHIPFDVHGADCGAPDCYSTDIRFSFKLGNKLVFPKNLQFIEFESGCVDQEQTISGHFLLIEKTEKHVIYYSAKHKRTLVLFSSNEISGTIAYYFTGLEQNRINGTNVYSIMRNFNEEDENSIYPYTSWVLTTNEYDHVIR